MEYENTGAIAFAIIFVMGLNPCSNGIRKYADAFGGKPYDVKLS